MAFTPENLGLATTGLPLLRDLIHERTGLFYDNGRCEMLSDRLAPLVLERGFRTFLDFYYLLKHDDRAALGEWRHVIDVLSVQETYFWREVDQIRGFEEMLVENGTAILKFFLHISKKEQKKRLEERIHDPEKRWKWNSGDLEERRLWGKYMRAFEDVISATSTMQAPWYIVPADRKWFRNLVVADRVLDALEAMKLRQPPPPPGINFAKLRIV